MTKGERIQVYLSSSFRDLKEVRADLIACINKQKSVFSLQNMEDYSPESTYPADKCVGDVRSCDVYVGIFAWRYGSIEPRSNKSITELELLAAEQEGIEILGYVLDETASWPLNMVDRDRANIERLRRHVLDTHLSAMFTSKEELCAIVISGLNAAKDRLSQRPRAKTTPASEPNQQNHRRSYLRWLVSCHERLDFRGIRHASGGAVSVPLEQVYLALQADSTNALERAAARSALLEAVFRSIESGEIDGESAAYASWYVVADNPTMPSLETRDRINALDPSRKELLNLGEAYFRESQLVVLGDPGSGKTTLARWLTLVSSQALLEGRPNLVTPLYQVDPAVDDLNRTIGLGKSRLPLLVRIAEYADERQRCAESGRVAPTLLEFLGRQTWLGSAPVWDEDSSLCGQKIDVALLNQLFQQTLKDGEALVILDGLDEVPASLLRDEIVEEVDAFAQQWIRRRFSVSQAMGGGQMPALVFSSVTADTPGNRLIITSRIAGYHLSPLQGETIKKLGVTQPSGVE